MGSKTKKQKQAEEKIKRAIVDGYRRGVCDKDGNSVIGSHGGPVAKQRVLTGSCVRTFVRRNGKLVEKK